MKTLIFSIRKLWKLKRRKRRRKTKNVTEVVAERDPDHEAQRRDVVLDLVVETG